MLSLQPAQNATPDLLGKSPASVPIIFSSLLPCNRSTMQPRLILWQSPPQINLARNEEWAPLDLRQSDVHPELLDGLASGTVHLHFYTLPRHEQLPSELQSVSRWKHASTASQKVTFSEHREALVPFMRGQKMAAGRNERLLEREIASAYDTPILYFDNNKLAACALDRTGSCVQQSHIWEVLTIGRDSAGKAVAFAWLSWLSAIFRDRGQRVVGQWNFRRSDCQAFQK